MAVSQHPDDRQRVHALAQIVARGLAEFLVGSHQVEHVIDDLECHAVREAEAGETFQRPGVSARDQPADAARSGVQLRSLALDGQQVLVLGAAAVIDQLQLTHLPLAQPPDGGGQQRGHVGPQRRCELRRLGQQEIARQDRLEVPPAMVDGLDAASCLGIVHDVVVIQRAQVHQLHGHAAAHHLVGDCWGRGALGIERQRRSDDKRRTQALAACRDQMRCHLGEEFVAGDRGGAQCRFDAGQVVVGTGSGLQGRKQRHGATVNDSDSRERSDKASLHCDQETRSSRVQGSRQEAKCLNASPIGLAEWWCWRRKKRAC